MLSETYQEAAQWLCIAGLGVCVWLLSWRR